MRATVGLMVLMLGALPGIASGQSFVVQGSAGVTTIESAHNLSYGYEPGLTLAAGAGIIASRVTFLVEVERTDRRSQLQRDARGEEFGFRGGTLTLASAQLRVNAFEGDRFEVYGVGGFAAGVSRLNASVSFPDGRSSDVRAILFGGGVLFPLSERLNLFTDWRVFLGGDLEDELLAVAPLRAGLSLRF